MSKASARASLWIWSLQQETLGLDHRDEFERLPSKVLFETWDICSVDIDGVHTIQLWPPASVDQLTLLACNAKKAPMSCH